MQKNSLDFSILVNNKPLREYYHNNRYYVEGRNNSEFEILIRNNSSRRIETVVSVDGLDVLDGTVGNSKKDGYLVPAWSSIKIDGWRLNQSEVARFQFGAQEGSYANEQGIPRNIGVIGIAAFYEEQQLWWQSYYNTMGANINNNHFNDSPIYHNQLYQNQYSTKSATSSRRGPCGSSAGSSSGVTRGVQQNSASEGGQMLSAQGLGTKFGQLSQSQVTTVSFKRDLTTPPEILEIHYNDRENLKKLGIPVGEIDRNLEERETARPFEDIGGGCKPPAGWKR